MGGIISAWNISVVGGPARVVMASATSKEDTAGVSSSTCEITNVSPMPIEGVRAALTPLSIEILQILVHPR